MCYEAVYYWLSLFSLFHSFFILYFWNFKRKTIQVPCHCVLVSKWTILILRLCSFLKENEKLSRTGWLWPLALCPPLYSPTLPFNRLHFKLPCSLPSSSYIITPSQSEYYFFLVLHSWNTSLSLGRLEHLIAEITDSLNQHVVPVSIFLSITVLSVYIVLLYIIWVKWIPH